MGVEQFNPTWIGYVADTYDALLLFQDVIDGRLKKTVRRAATGEKAKAIYSGAVFIYERTASGITRWTDGLNWSPSRRSENFLIYRELKERFGSGQKRHTIKKAKARRMVDFYPRQDLCSTQPQLPLTQRSVEHEDSLTVDSDSKKSLLGSLINSYSFKIGGLMKKTISILSNGARLHLVCYYKPEDVQKGLLKRRRDDQKVNKIGVTEELIQQQNFRVPFELPDHNNVQSSASATVSPYKLPASSRSCESFMPELDAVPKPTLASNLVVPWYAKAQLGLGYYSDLNWQSLESAHLPF